MVLAFQSLRMDIFSCAMMFPRKGVLQHEKDTESSEMVGSVVKFYVLEVNK